MSAFTERLRELEAKAASGVLVVGPAAEMVLRAELRNALPAIIEALEAAEASLLPGAWGTVGVVVGDDGIRRFNRLAKALDALDAIVENK